MPQLSFTNNAVPGAILGGWQLSTTFVFESGRPFTPTIGDTSQPGTLCLVEPAICRSASMR